MGYWRDATLGIMVGICALAICLIAPVSALEDFSALRDFVQQNEDARIEAIDLAFILATHNFDASPKGDYVIVKINSTIYRLTPNGDRPGLADIVSEK